MLRRVLVIAVAVLTPVWLSAQQGTDPDIKLVTPLAPLLGSMKKAHVSGSLEFSGRCGFAGLPRLPAR